MLNSHYLYMRVTIIRWIIITITTIIIITGALYGKVVSLLGPIG